MPPWRSIRADDRLSHAAAVGGHRVGVEPAAAVADEDLRPAGVHLGVDGDRAGVGGELGRVGERLAGRGDERLGALVERRVADRDDVDRDRRGRPRPRPPPPRARREAVAGARRVAVEQPGPQLALLAAGEGATSRGSSARFCIRVSVCRTESCRWAATSARSWERIRSARSVARLRPEAPQERREDQRRARRAATTTASTTSRASPRTPLRTGRAAPRRARGRRRSRRGRGRRSRERRSRRGLRLTGAPEAAGTAAASVRAARRRDWRHSSAAPAAARISGQIERVGPPDPELAQDEQQPRG